MAELEACRSECRNYNSEMFRLKAANDETVEQLDVVRRENKNLADEIKDLNTAARDANTALDDSSFASKEGKEKKFKPSDARSMYIAFSQLICGVNTGNPIQDTKGQFSTDIMIALYRITNIPVFTIGCALYDNVRGKWMAQVDNECFEMPEIEKGYEYLGYPIAIKKDTESDTPPILLANIGGGHFQCVIPTLSLGISGVKGPWVTINSGKSEGEIEHLAHGDDFSFSSLKEALEKVVSLYSEQLADLGFEKSSQDVFLSFVANLSDES